MVGSGVEAAASLVPASRISVRLAIAGCPLAVAA